MTDKLGSRKDDALDNDWTRVILATMTADAPSATSNTSSTAHPPDMGDPECDHRLARLVQLSRYADRLITREPSYATWASHIADTPATETIGACVAAAGFAGVASGSELDVRLRRLRQQAMLAILMRDLNRLATQDEVLAAISMLADVVVQTAVGFHRAALAREWGVDATSTAADFIVVGMGKLGAAELNVSSDIDLIFVYPEDGDATVTRSWHEFHATLGKRVIRALDDVTADGFVFRVDMRLRPFGTSGPLVASLATLSDYFIAHARPWERYAWLKGRALTGSAPHVDALQQLVQPFVYRRYHDFAAIGEMRVLHGQIREEAAKRGKDDDIKVGHGGIREIEFVAQLAQLVRGGREPALQVRGTREALAAIARLGLMPANTVAALTTAYAFLRDLEHRLQYRDDQQTQALPRSDEERAVIADAMGTADANTADWAGFMTVLDAHRRVVRAAFESAFGDAAAAEARTETPDLVRTPGQKVPEVPADAGVLPESPFPLFRQRRAAYVGSSRVQSLSPRLAARVAEALDAIEPAILSAQPESAAHADQGAVRLADIVEAIDRRETYLALLAEYPQARSRLARVVLASAWAADLIRRHPILLDDLTRPANTAAIDWVQEADTLRTRLAESADDIERQYDVLRHAKQRLTLRIFIDDIEGRLGVMALSDALTTLADLLLEVTVERAWHQLYPGDVLAGYAVIGYGKLGSKELGYQSDLDLVFLYDEASPIGRTAPEKFARLTQRINSWLNTATAAGVLYETDLRLRPDGASGLFVSSLEAFTDYQQKRAWTWEHQALTRARVVTGDAGLRAAFEQLRRDILSAERDHAKLKRDIVEMRNRMRQEKKDRADALDLKNTRGGVVDIEFIVQYLILAWSRAHPEFVGNLGNFALITRAAALGIIDEGSAATLGKAYLAYRARLSKAQLNNERKAWIGLDELADERAAVVRAWRAVFAGVG